MNKFLALIIMGSSLLVIDPGKNLSAQPQIELSQSVNGPAMLSQSDDFGYSVEYTINAMNIGDADGSYDLDVSFLPATDSFGDDGDKNFQIFMISATLAYAGGDDSQSATPMPASGTFGDTIKMLSAETLLAGNSEAWTLTVFYMFNFPESAPDGRGRNEGGDFLLAEIDTRACSDSNPVPNTGFYTAVAGSSTEIDGSDNGSCTDIPVEQIDLDLSVDGPAVLNGYGNFNVSYTLVANNTGEGPGFYDVVTTFASGPGIEVLMSYLSFSGGTDQTGVVENPPATVENPAPLNQGGAWVAGELLLPGEAETWSIVVAYSVEPALTSAEGSDCDTTNAGGKNTGFNTVVEGSVTETDLTNNTACTGLQYPAPALPDIDLKIERLEPTIAKPNSTIDVVYLVTASNNGAAPGIYDLVSLQDSREFIPLLSAELEYTPGGESQTGMPMFQGPLDFAAAKFTPVGFRTPVCRILSNTIVCIDGTDVYTLVTAEPLAAGQSETWTIRATYGLEGLQQLINPNEILQTVCMEIRGSVRVADPDNRSYLLDEDRSDNEACLSHLSAAPIPIMSAWWRAALCLMLIFVGVIVISRRTRRWA